MNSELDEYRDIYVNDMREHLQNMNRTLVELEHDPENGDLLNEIFRAAHTIKGNSATMGYNNVAELAHEMESLLDRVRNKEMGLEQEIMDILFESFDNIESMVESIAANTEVKNPKDTIEKIRQVLEFTRAEAGVDDAQVMEEQIELGLDELRLVAQAIDSGKTVYEITITIDEDCQLKSAKATLVMRNLEKFGDKVMVMPDEATIKNTNPSVFTVLLASDADDDILEKSALGVSDISGVDIKVFEDGKEEEVEFDLDSFEENTVIEEAAPTGNTQVQKKKNKQVNLPAAPPQTIQNIRVSIKQLDSLMNRVGELVINRIVLEHITSKLENTELSESINHFSRILEELQQDVMEIRMIPVEHVFSKYPRVIRDLSKSRGKKVKLVIEGGDIELDRTVLEGISDPLIHILRNSIDHGIETPEERLATGKPEEGTVLLRARRSKSNVIIEVTDDGAGIRPEVIRDSALSKGLISEDEAETMSVDELISLVFSPGFSTAKSVSDISGRGVGMDVVKRDIERLGGSIKIYSTSGEGTRLKLKLPLTLAIIKALVVRVGSETYVLPLNNVVESVRVNDDQIKMVDKKETCVIRDEVVPLVRLNELFEIESTSNDNAFFVVIVEYEDLHVGLVVDELVEQQEVVIKSLGPSLGRIEGFAGATIIRNGNVALILDINSMLK